MKNIKENRALELDLSARYDDDFYRSQLDGSYRSAVLYVDYLTKIFKPRRVVDVGCGRGT